MYVYSIYTNNYNNLKIPNYNSGAPAARTPSRAPYSYGKQKETHELIFSWLSRLAALLVGAYAHGDDGGVAQHGGHTPNNGLTETCSQLLGWPKSIY